MKKQNKHMDYIKANRKGNRLAELENSTGWIATHKIHKSKRSYSRKDKHKKSDNPDFFFARNFISKINT